jgi:hypothetical protein
MECASIQFVDILCHNQDCHWNVWQGRLFRNGSRLTLQAETKGFSSGGKERPSRGPTWWDVILFMRTISEQTIGRLHREFQKCGSSSYLREIIAKLRIATKIPTGYQDKTGFHFGVEPYASDGPRQLLLVRFHQSQRGRDASTRVHWSHHETLQAHSSYTESRLAV